MALIQVNFVSKSLFRTVAMQVILPVDKLPMQGQAPREEKPFKTLYLLHGLIGNHTDWVTQTSIQRWAEARNLAVVMPAGENSFYIDQPELGNLYGTFIGEELVEITRKMFPLSRKREDTFLGGLSMGGFGAVRNGLKYYKTFSHIITLSGALHLLENTGEAMSAKTLAAEDRCFGNLAEAVQSDKNPRYLLKYLREAQKNGEEIPLPKVYQSCGTEDSLLTANRIYKNLFMDSGIDLTYEETPGGHNWDFWESQIQKALQWLPLEASSAGISSGNTGSL